MDNIYFLMIIALAVLAIADLVVGVSNDAVNFLNSSIGSRVAPYYVIMIVASLGILAGVTFSGGMMEVARKGIYHPQFFFIVSFTAHSFLTKLFVIFFFAIQLTASFFLLSLLFYAIL